MLGFSPLSTLPLSSVVGEFPPPIKLYLRNTTNNGISIGGIPCYDWINTAGTSVDTAIVNSTASGTNIPFTKTAGGNRLWFITQRVGPSGWTITAETVALWLQESALTVNAGARIRLHKWSSGTLTELSNSPSDKGTELSDTNALQAWVSGITGTLVEDERLVLEIDITNIGTMAVGTVTLNFNGENTPANISLVQNSTAQTISNSTTNQFTFASTPTLGNKIIVETVGWTTTTAAVVNSVTDNKGNTYTKRLDKTASSNTRITIWEADVISTSATFTVSVNFASNTDSACNFEEWAGLLVGTSYDQQSTAVGPGSAHTSLSTGTTPTLGQANELAISVYGANTSSATSGITVPTGYTLNGVYQDSVTIIGMGTAYKTVNNTTGIEATWTFNSFAIADEMTGIATFKAAITGADSYINVYPTVTLKAESSGVTVGLTGLSSTTNTGNIGNIRDKALVGISSSTNTGNITYNLNMPIIGQLNTISSGTIVPNNSKSLTGINSTANSGLVVPNFDKQLSGINFTLNQGTLAVVVDKTLTGQVSTINTGTIVYNLNKVLTGEISTFTTGTITASVGSGDITLGLSGLLFNILTGTISPSLDKSLTTNLSVANTGNISPSLDKSLTTNLSVANTGNITTNLDKSLTTNLSVANTGNITTSLDKSLTTNLSVANTGNLKGNLDKSLTTNLSVANTGNISTSLDKSLTTNLSVANAGNITTSLDKSLTTNLSVANAGNITTSLDKSLTGTSSTTFNGQVVGNLFITPTGQQSTISQGTLNKDISKAISGIISTIAQGNILYNLDKALSGQQVIISQGTISAQTGGDVTLGLTGIQSNFNTGQFNLSISKAISGLVSTLSQGNITVTQEVLVALVGQAINTTLGSINKNIDISTTGLSVTAYQNLVTAALSKGLTGSLSTLATGSIKYDISITPNSIQISFNSGQLGTNTNISITGINTTILQNNLYLLSNILDILNVIFVQDSVTDGVVQSEIKDNFITNSIEDILVQNTDNSNYAVNEPTYIVVQDSDNSSTI